MTHSTSSARHAGRAPALLDSAGFRAAVIGSFTKLAPQHAFQNPVMAVVWLGTLLTAGLTLAGTTTPGIGWSVTALLFVTVLFAPFMHVMDKFAYNRYLRRTGQQPKPPADTKS